MPSPGFQVEIVILDYDVSISNKASENVSGNPLPSGIKENPPPMSSGTSGSIPGTEGGNKKGIEEKDDVFSDMESEGSVRKHRVLSNEVSSNLERDKEPENASILNQKVRDLQTTSKDNTSSLSSIETSQRVKDNPSIDSSSIEPSKLVDHGSSKADTSQLPASDFKAIAAASAADASVFTFGDEEDFESEDD